MFNVGLVDDYLDGHCAHLAVAGDVFDGVLFCAVRFPTSCLT